MKNRTAGGNEIVHIRIEKSSYAYVHSYTVSENLLVAPLERKLHIYINNRNLFSLEVHSVANVYAVQFGMFTMW